MWKRGHFPSNGIIFRLLSQLESGVWVTETNNHTALRPILKGRTGEGYHHSNNNNNNNNKHFRLHQRPASLSRALAALQLSWRPDGQRAANVRSLMSLLAARSTSPRKCPSLWSIMIITINIYSFFCVFLFSSWGWVAMGERVGKGERVKSGETDSAPCSHLASASRWKMEGRRGEGGEPQDIPIPITGLLWWVGWLLSRHMEHFYKLVATISSSTNKKRKETLTHTHKREREREKH